MTNSMATKLEELNLVDRFLFDEVMEDTESYEALVGILLEKAFIGILLREPAGNVRRSGLGTGRREYSLTQRESTGKDFHRSFWIS